jgi:hypothetical protein
LVNFFNNLPGDINTDYRHIAKPWPLAAICMNKFIGYSILGIGVLGFFLLWIFRDTTILLKELWFVISLCTIVAGSYFLAKYKLAKIEERHGKTYSRLAEVEQLKRTGDKVRITLDNAEVKSRSYQHEVINDELPSRIQMLDALYDENRNYKTQEIQQTYIVFYKRYGGQTYKFISQAMAETAEVVRRYIDGEKGIDLYIDPNNPHKYYFDVPFL